MIERPILFSGPMVRAILEGRKSQTRRVLRVPDHPAVADWVLDSEYRAAARAPSESVAEQYVSTFPYGRVPCRYGRPGDRLWVRETWRQGNTGVLYRADDICPSQQHWRPSIFLKRAACRLVLEVTAVRVERLQDISEADAMAEGVEAVPVRAFEHAHTPPPREAVPAYRALWDSLNAKRAPWSRNPWVWVVEFRKRGAA